ncbi:lateral signaling target protein 2 [Biomphalaria pfeifferi]|uniref:Lateral signaling target protein 2 n=1 Tax=Biomphalaria pfeifferi TaxID=112525 RepID=A0AAD8B929_BIOPF|nr:lateral signaling target protein 2 [Biomphalaria pfeifferi]
MIDGVLDSNQRGCDVRDGRQTLSDSVHQTNSDYAIPLPVRKYTTTNPNTLSPTYHLLYDLTQPPEYPPRPKRSLLLNSGNPDYPRAKPSTLGPPPLDMNKSTEKATLRYEPGTRVPLSYLVEGRCGTRMNEPMSDRFTQSVIGSNINIETSLWNENVRLTESDVASNFKGSLSASHVCGSQCQQTEINNRRELVDKTYSRSDPATNISARLVPNRTTGLVVSRQSHTSECGETFNERGFPVTVASQVAGAIFQSNGVSYNTPLHTQERTSFNGRRFLDKTEVSVKDVFLFESGVSCDLSTEFSHLAEYKHATNNEHCEHSSGEQSDSFNSLHSQNLKLTKRAVFKCEGDSVRLLILEDCQEHNDDSGVASDNETIRVSDNFISKSVEECRQHGVSSLSKIPSLLRGSFTGRSKHKSRIPGKTSSSPSLIQINNFDSQSNKNRINRWHNLQFHASVLGHTVSGQQEEAINEELNPRLPADLRVIDRSRVTRDQTLKASVKRDEQTIKNDLIDQIDVTRSAEIKSILLNKENCSRGKPGHKVNNVQFSDHTLQFSDHTLLSTSSALQPPDHGTVTARPNRAILDHTSANPSSTGPHKDIIDRSKYIIKPREIVLSHPQGSQVDSHPRESGRGSPSSWFHDGKEVTDLSLQSSISVQDTSGEKIWSSNNLFNTSSVENWKFSPRPPVLSLLEHTPSQTKLLESNIPSDHLSQQCGQESKVTPRQQCGQESKVTPRQQCGQESKVTPRQQCGQESKVTPRQQCGQESKVTPRQQCGQESKVTPRQQCGQESKVTPRQKFERRHNKVDEKVQAQIKPTDQRDISTKGTLYDHKESPRARFERDRAARTQAVTAGNKENLNLKDASDSITEIDSELLKNSFSTSTLVPPPLPPRVKLVSETFQNSNCLETDVLTSQYISETPLGSRQSTFSSNNENNVSKALVHETSISRTTSRQTDSHCATANIQHSPKQESHPLSFQTSVIGKLFQVSDIAKHNEYLRQVLNHSSVHQLRLLFADDQDLCSSLTSLSSCQQESLTSVSQFSSENRPHSRDNQHGIDTFPAARNDHFSEQYFESHQKLSSKWIRSDSQTEVNNYNILNTARHCGTQSESCVISAQTKTDHSPPDRFPVPSRDTNSILSSVLKKSGADSISSLVVTEAEEEMLASKGIRIYESVNDYVQMVRSPLHKSLSSPQFVWEGNTYLIVPTVLEDRTLAEPPRLNNVNLLDFMAHRSISDSGGQCQVKSDNTLSMSNDHATYMTMTSSLDKKLSANHRAMSVEVLCTPGASNVKIVPEANTQERGYVEWRTCSGWLGRTDLKPTAQNRNSRGYVDWDTIWAPSPGNKSSHKEEDHVYDVIGEELNQTFVNSKSTTLIGNNKDHSATVVDIPPALPVDIPPALPVDIPPELPERTYISRLKLRSNSHHSDSPNSPRHSDSGSFSPRLGHSSCHCKSHGRKHHHQHRHHHHHIKPLSKPPPPAPREQQDSIPPPQPVFVKQEVMSPHSYNYAEVNKLKGYTFAHSTPPSDAPPKPHRPEHSAVSSENYWRLAPVTSAESMTSWESGDVLDYIDGLHDAMASKRRENIYILLNNKKTRAKFSESLEIESRLLSRGLLSNVTSLSPTTLTDSKPALSKPGLIQRKGAIAPVSSTYV